MDDNKFVDESWKEAAFKEKEKLDHPADPDKAKSKLYVKEPIKADEDETESEDQESDHSDGHPEPFEVNFLNYVTSLGFQALIFLGEIPHPATNQKEENIGQAKFLIDTLVMLREKTKGNLNNNEENLLNASIYELQMKFIEVNTRKNQAKE